MHAAKEFWLTRLEPMPLLKVDLMWIFAPISLPICCPRPPVDVSVWEEEANLKATHARNTCESMSACRCLLVLRSWGCCGVCTCWVM